ncbi:tetratricopeptide repeat protein [Brucepastera parasyntrophica]|uniref:tetratricopeptide repeat protein n=1 Tax=Brucepastera parasyntrophica TaxID=2880008 RepID=UPI00210B7690|nr:tetratricopeptide repeat protein [Brucepastera parasyntrophica]ULQ59767.1 tetratricopeptide repeat protein [Brucepastera parasyntrophica]
MIYIYFELRYLRQLQIICPAVIDSFFAEIEKRVRKNGGAVLRLASGNLYSFDDSSIGFVFAASRVIDDLQALINQNKRVKEYLALVDYSPAAADPESFREKIMQYDNLVIPAQGILLTQEAFSVLGTYVSSVPLEKTSLRLYTKTNVETPAEKTVSVSRDTLTLSFTNTYITNPVIIFHNIFASLPDADYTSLLSQEEQSGFIEKKYAVDMSERLRFSPDRPDYYTAACISYYSMLLSVMKRAGYTKAVIEIPDTAVMPESFQNIFEQFRRKADFQLKKTETRFQVPDTDSIPADMLELAYLIYRAEKFLFIDELPEFFVFMGKQADFLSSLGNLFYTKGILADPVNLLSLNPALFSRISAAIGIKSKILDMSIARFLWTKYEKGSLLPTLELFDVLNELGYTIPDSFLIRCLYHNNDPVSLAKKLEQFFSKPKLIQAVYDLEKAIARYNEGDYSKASYMVKDVLHTFQQEKILAGEYRAFSLAAMITLVQKSANDSVVYLEYALENAEKMHDSFGLLRTRFDIAMVYFVIGKFHSSLHYLDLAQDVAKKCYAKDWEVLIVFMKGRIAFELGDYQNAEARFQAAIAIANMNGFLDSIPVCRTWYARALVHQKNFSAAEEILLEYTNIVPEAWLFLLETAIISEKKSQKNIQFPDTLDFFAPGPESWSPDRVIWKSGFSPAEDRCMGTAAESRILTRFYRVLLLYYSVFFNPEAGIQSKIAEMEETARAAIDMNDPYAAVYYFLCYNLSLKTTGIISADTLTYLSRGFKYLQKRAGGITDNTMRESLLQKPVWNSRLYRAARDNMLI